MTIQTQTPANIIYLRADNSTVNEIILRNLEIDVNCKISVSSSWMQIINEINTDNEITESILLVDSNLFRGNNFTIQEIVAMISTVYKVSAIPKKLKLGVVISEPCATEVIKLLQEADILGVVPCGNKFSYDNTLEGLNNIIFGKSHWPKYAISSVPKTSIILKNTGITLTSRQRQVMTLVCNRGLSNKKIAQVLHITESTVKVHMTAILKEYGVQNRTQLALAAGTGLKL